MLTEFDYFITPLAERVRHTNYSQYKPGGWWGHGFGIIGSTMLLLLLLYSLRKRTRLFGQFGSMSHWLQIHIFFGISGPMFIILHSTFKLNGLIAVSFWSMIAVALSGVLGRYLYLQIPRNIRGHELTHDELDKLNTNLNLQLQEQFKLTIQEIEEISSLVMKRIQGSPSFFSILLHFIADDLLFQIRRPKIFKKLKDSYGIDGKQKHELVSLLYQKNKLTRRIRFLNRIHQVFHYWHVFHKPFAILMYLIMFVHVGITVWLGYRWIF